MIDTCTCVNPKINEESNERWYKSVTKNLSRIKEKLDFLREWPAKNLKKEKKLYGRKKYGRNNKIFDGKRHWWCLPAYKIFLSLDRDIAVIARVGSPNMTVGGPSDPPE